MEKIVLTAVVGLIEYWSSIQTRAWYDAPIVLAHELALEGSKEAPNEERLSRLLKLAEETVATGHNLTIGEIISA